MSTSTSQPSSSVAYFYGQWLPIVGRPVLALTYDSVLANEHYSEAFVFLENRAVEDFCGMLWRADPREVRQLGEPREILEEKAKEWAKAEVDYRISSGQQPPGIVLPTWEWRPGTRQLLVDLWIRGKFSDPIRTHCLSSKSEALRNDVKLCLRLRQDILGSDSIG